MLNFHASTPTSKPKYIKIVIILQFNTLAKLLAFPWSTWMLAKLLLKKFTLRSEPNLKHLSIVFKVSASLMSSWRKKIVSSPNWRRGTFKEPDPICIPINSIFSSTSLTNPFKHFVTTNNRKFANGSPCQSPLCVTNSSSELSFKRTSMEDDCSQLHIHSIHFRQKPNLCNIYAKKSHLIES